MLNTHRCAFCGSEAPEGSVTYDFIKQRLNDVIAILSPKPQEDKLEIKKFFKSRNIEELKELGKVLAYTGKDISGISDEIESLIHENEERRTLIAKLRVESDSIKEKIEQLFANSSTGENLRDYVTNISIVNRWHEQKQSSALKMNKLLTKTIPDLKEQLVKMRSEQNKLAKGTSVGPLLEINNFFRYFNGAVERTELSTYQELLNRLADEANVFLARLNVDDFTGIIKIYFNHYKQLKIELQDKNGQLITNPNTSLLTTMHISILFAISELTRENRDADYPLIFDAPTSSFDEGKDKAFYECLNSQVDKQCIVVTKSYLFKDSKGEYVTDKKALSNLNCQKYRIRKQTGFDKLDITTIDTIVEEIKED